MKTQTPANSGQRRAPRTEHMSHSKSESRPQRTQRVNLERCLLLTRAHYDALFALGGLEQVGAWLFAVSAYAYGTYRDFAHAMSLCGDAAREKALKECLLIWQRKDALRRRAAHRAKPQRSPDAAA